MDNLTLAGRIISARKEAGITQGKLAQMLDIAVSTLNKYEKGHRTPDAELLGRMANILKCDPGWLLTGRKAQAEGQAGGYDPDLMRQIIETVEALFEKEKLHLPPKKKSELIDLLYEELRGAEHDTEELKGKILRFTRLAS